MMLWAKVLLVFVVGIVVDIVWAMYIRRTSEGKPVAAANFGAVILGLGAITTTSYIENKWLLIPAMLGNWVGTYGIVKWDSRHKGKEEWDGVTLSQCTTPNG